MSLENGTVGRRDGTERGNVSALVEEFIARGLVPEAIEDETAADLGGGRPEVALRRILQYRRSQRRQRQRR
jgi:hypothetical protein